MGHTGGYEALLQRVREIYGAQPALQAFAPFPNDLAPQAVTPRLRAPYALLRAETKLASRAFADLHAAIIAAGPEMLWRETYPEGHPETAFMERWGCFSIVGEGGPFASRQVRIFVVYMPARLYYPWHTHPAEEQYLVIAGQARFKRQGRQDEILSEGQVMEHESQEAHAIETEDHPVLCLVTWRSHLNTPPVLVPDTQA